jgi:hypothetical protein
MCGGLVELAMEPETQTTTRVLVLRGSRRERMELRTCDDVSGQIGKCSSVEVHNPRYYSIFILMALLRPDDFFFQVSKIIGAASEANWSFALSPNLAQLLPDPSLR